MRAENSGLGVGVKDTGRVRLCVRGGVVEIHSSAACIGQGLGTVLEQIVAQAAAIAPAQLRYCPPDTSAAPDAGNTTASRQTLFTGEAARRAALQLRHALAGTSLQALEGQTFLGEYTGVTEPDGQHKPRARQPHCLRLCDACSGVGGGWACGIGLCCP